MQLPAEPFARLNELVAENRAHIRFSRAASLQSQRILDAFNAYDVAFHARTDVRSQNERALRLIEESLRLVARSRELTNAIRRR